MGESLVQAMELALESGPPAAWEAFREAVPSRPELADVDLATLIARAHWQHATAEGVRLEAARTAPSWQA